MGHIKDSSLQFILITITFFLIFRLLDEESILEELKYVTIFSVAWLFIIVSIAGGWPLSPPLGNVRKYSSRIRKGLLMTLIWAAASMGSYLTILLVLNELITTYAPALLWASALWGVVLDSWPLRHYRPVTAFIIGATVLHIFALLVSLFIKIDEGYLVSVLTHHLAWSFLLSPPFATQAYHFRKLSRQPRIGIAILASASLLTLFSWGAAVQMFKIMEDWISNTFFSSMILWAFVYSYSFSFAGISRFTQPTRGYIALAIITVLAAVWSFVQGVIFGWRIPVFLNLSYILVAVVIHDVFWLRAPLSPPLIIGMPPPYHRDIGSLKRWYEQLEK